MILERNRRSSSSWERGRARMGADATRWRHRIHHPAFTTPKNIDAPNERSLYDYEICLSEIHTWNYCNFYRAPYRRYSRLNYSLFTALNASFITGFIRFYFNPIAGYHVCDFYYFFLDVYSIKIHNRLQFY